MGPLAKAATRRPAAARVAAAAGLALVALAALRGATHSAESSPLRHCGTFSARALRESSGLVKSRRYPDVFWTHNDSGDSARVFAVRADGAPVAGGEDDRGIPVLGATNVDWEDIAADDAGNLIVADTGNNDNTRRDLALYVIPEPDPRAATTARAVQRIPVAYPDQKGFPPPDRNFDAEALFWARGKLYLLTKHRSDTLTTLYRLDTADPVRPNVLTRLGSFDVGGMATAADATPDGRRLAVLTYTGLWLFEAKGEGDDYFGGKVRRLPFFAWQCEAVCFDGDRLLVGNEQRELYEVRVADVPESR